MISVKNRIPFFWKKMEKNLNISENPLYSGAWGAVGVVKITSTLPHKALGSASFHEGGMLRYFDPRAYRRTSTKLASPQSENGRALSCWSPGTGFNSPIVGCPSPFKPSSGINSHTFFPNLRGYILSFWMTRAGWVQSAISFIDIYNIYDQTPQGGKQLPAW